MSTINKIHNLHGNNSSFNHILFNFKEMQQDFLLISKLRARIIELKLKDNLNDAELYELAKIQRQLRKLEA